MIMLRNKDSDMLHYHSFNSSKKIFQQKRTNTICWGEDVNEWWSCRRGSEGLKATY